MRCLCGSFKVIGILGRFKRDSFSSRWHQLGVFVPLIATFLLHTPFLSGDLV
jgi:hypothetical protein